MIDRIKSVEDSTALSVEKIIDIIRSVRNDIIKNFLTDGHSSSYFEAHFKKELSHIKKEFLNRDLAELLISPVDLAHYAGLINQIKQSNTTSLNETDRGLFYQELDHVFKKYSF